jgi:hypothetical protein
MAPALKKIGASVFTHDGGLIYLWPVWFFTTYAQVTGNQSVQKTFATLQGKGKFTDPEVVEALQLIFNFATDGLFSPMSSACRPLERRPSSKRAGPPSGCTTTWSAPSGPPIRPTWT